MTALFDPMSTPALPPVSYDLRDACLRPQDVRLVLPGALVCPNDDVLLLQRAGGWYCPTCLGGWNAEGRRGQWLPIHDSVLRADAERHLRLVADIEVADVEPEVASVDGDPAVAAVAARVRRIDRVTAATIAVGVVAAGGWKAGELARPWEHLIPDGLLWTLIGVAVGGSAAVVAVVLLLDRLAARRAAGVDEDARLGMDLAGVDLVDVDGEVRHAG